MSEVNGGLLANSSVSKVFNNSNNILGFQYGNLTGIKSADYLKKVKSEMKSDSRFSNSYMEDVVANQQYFRNLLSDPPMAGNVQYFVQNHFQNFSSVAFLQTNRSFNYLTEKILFQI